MQRNALQTWSPDSECSGCTKCHDDPPKKDDYAEAILGNKADTAPEFRSWRTKMHFDRVVVGLN